MCWGALAQEYGVGLGDKLIQECYFAFDNAKYWDILVHTFDKVEYEENPLGTINIPNIKR